MDGNIVRGGIAMCCWIIGGMSATLTTATTTAAAQSVAVDARPESTADQTRVTLHVTGMKLEHLLRLIARRAGFEIYMGEGLPLSIERTLSVHEVPVRDAFAQALAGTGLRAAITGKTVLLVPANVGSPVAQGGISGRVVDATTQRGLQGATVSLSGANRSVTSGDDGTFRIAGVAPGSYTVSVRMLGYVKAAKTISVIEGQTTTVDVALTPSANALDQVVVTGTIVATAQREIPNAMTVITAKDIEQRGITKIDQLFRGDVPGLFAANIGTVTYLDEVVMFSRGATALSYASAGTSNGTNPLKTYVDGIELTNPQYLSQIDPKSIDRIEIVTGPQASTIYGSNAINGVIQVFTKRGTSTRPQLTATLFGGWVENNYRPTRTPQYDDAVQVNGVEGHWAYNAGGSWVYMGPWSPGKQTARVSGFGGARLQRGPITTDGSLRLATTRNQQRGSPQQGLTAAVEKGWYSLNTTNGLWPRTTQTRVGQTLGLSLGVAPVSWWSHEVVVGVDRSAGEIQRRAPGFISPRDTLLTLYDDANERHSQRYTSTVQVPLAPLAKAVVTVGADAWQRMSTSMDVSALVLTGTLTPSGTPTVTRVPEHNTGGFLQAQVGLWEQLFVTYGLRAEWNAAYGDEAQPNWAPRYGMAYTRDIEAPWGAMTVKLRASYGRSTRPPAVGAKEATPVSVYVGAATAQGFFIPYYGDFDYLVANPELAPEQQRGGEGGLELYLGRRGSLVVTRYNQTVEDLIARPQIDSVRSKDPANQPSQRTSCDAEGYCYTSRYQNLNVGSIRNQGWELQGTVVMGPLTTRGTYSWTKSRTMGVNPQYRGFFTPSSYPQYQPGATFQYFPEHTWSGSVTYAQGRSMVTLNVSGTGMVSKSVTEFFSKKISSGIRLTADRWSLAPNANFTMPSAGYVQADLNASQRFSSSVEGIVQIQNLGDVYRNDLNATYAALGRQTKLGFRLRL